MAITVVKSAGVEGGEAQVGYCSVVRNTVFDFWDSTSLAGLSHSRSRHPVMKLGWVLLFVAGLVATAFDVINVVTNYSQRPYSTQMKSKNMAYTELPAITVCNQNNIQCNRLLSLMLDKLKGNDISLYYEVEQLYLISQCPFKSLKCDKVLQEYQNHFEDGGTVPETLMKGDTCMDCEVMIKMWSEECDEGDKVHQSYEFWWRRNECTKNLSIFEDTLKNLKLDSLPDSLAECPRMPNPPTPMNAENSSQTSSGNDSAQPSPDDLPAGSQEDSSSKTQDSRESSSGSISSIPDDELRSSTESGLSDPTDKPLDAVTSDETETVRDPDTKREARPPQNHEFEVYQEKRMESSQQYNNKINFLTHYMRLSDDLKKELGYSFEDLILDCKFMGYNCTNSSYFEKYFSPIYGNCYVYNYEGNKTISLSGPMQSFSLLINVHQETYLPELLTEKLGARVAVHRPLTHPNMEDEATDLSPGTASTIAIREVGSQTVKHKTRGKTGESMRTLGKMRRKTRGVQYSRLTSPWRSNCSSRWNVTSYLPHSETDNLEQGTIYSYSTCLKMCAQRMFIDYCECLHPLLPQSFIYSNKVYKEIRICNLTSDHEDNICQGAMLSSNSSYLLSPHECDCNLACSEKVYTKVVSSTAWPPEVSKLSVHTTYNMNENKVTENLLVLEVFFQSLIADYVEEEAEYPYINYLVSDLGGALSLYLGISIILLMEFVEFLLCLVYNSLLYLLGRYSPPQHEPPAREPMKSSVSPAVQPKPPSDISITTTTTVADLNYLRNLYGLERLLEALSRHGSHDASNNFRNYKSNVFDGAFHQ
ncbi:hypothetical protein O3P69_013890 [Scylla paramamosain]|uniref:Uncharacterized protein n=1 Tax=Scylla paramamosain TaxID=85552 RepID=A0AAW0SQ88_SCYPA